MRCLTKPHDSYGFLAVEGRHCKAESIDDMERKSSPMSNRFLSTLFSSCHERFLVESLSFTNFLLYSATPFVIFKIAARLHIPNASFADPMTRHFQERRVGKMEESVRWTCCGYRNVGMLQCEDTPEYSTYRGIVQPPGIDIII